MNGLYTLHCKVPIPCSSLIAWGRWMISANRCVARSEIGCLTVSTVFLGVDHNWFGGAPLLFETMIFDDIDDAYQVRCSTWAEAEEMHARAVAIAGQRVRNANEKLAEAFSQLGIKEKGDGDAG